MKKIRKMMTLALSLAMTLSLAACTGGGTGSGKSNPGGSQGGGSGAQQPASGTTYKVGIVKFMDHASLDQIESSLQAELDALGKELGVTFNYADYSANGQMDGTILQQIGAQMIANDVDVIVPIATPAVQAMLAAAEDT
ncbi:MAG: ABC transporter, partial [Lawsonibacter sp.]|nr:ABC transporter [Lawsonibacter sp.]